MSDSVPDGVPAADRATVTDTLPGALETAARLPAEVGSHLVGVARDSFAQGLSWIATAGVPVMLALAVIATALLRTVGTGGGEEESRDAETAADGGYVNR